MCKKFFFWDLLCRTAEPVGKTWQSNPIMLPVPAKCGRERNGGSWKRRGVGFSGWERFQEGQESSEPRGNQPTIASWVWEEPGGVSGGRSQGCRCPVSVASSLSVFSWVCWETFSSIMYKCTITYWNKSETPFLTLRLFKVICRGFFLFTFHGETVLEREPLLRLTPRADWWEGAV